MPDDVKWIESNDRKGIALTERLYYADPYMTVFSARVIERLALDERLAVALDRTCFYPTGGGQPCDLGRIGGVDVLDVATRPDDHAVIHTLAGEVAGERADCQIDWARRFDHMQHHTGQHILTRAFIEVAGANTVSFHLSPDSVTIGLDTPHIAPDTLARVEDLANQIVYEDRPVTARLVSPEEFAALDARMRKMPETLTTDGLRLIEIEGFDATACGGTHVARAGEIGIIKVIRLERNAQETRVEFRCGRRALEDYRLKNILANQLAAEFTVGVWEIDQAVGRLKADLKEARSALRDAQDRLVKYEAADLLAAAPTREGVRIIRAAFDGRNLADVRSLASYLRETPGSLILLGVAGEKAQLIFARSADLNHDMNAALKPALATLGTDRGGGRPEFAQGGGVAATVEGIEAALQEAEAAIFG